MSGVKEELLDEIEKQYVRCDTIEGEIIYALVRDVKSLRNELKTLQKKYDELNFRMEGLEK